MINYNLVVVNRFLPEEKLDGLARFFEKIKPAQPVIAESLEGYVGSDIQKKESPGDSLLISLEDALYDLGLSLSGGKFMAKCHSCEGEFEICCDIEDWDQDVSYCGKDRFCLP
jgi:hypothetical protein